LLALRDVGALHAAKTRSGRLPEPELVHIVNIPVDADKADELLILSARRPILIGRAAGWCIYKLPAFRRRLNYPPFLMKKLNLKRHSGIPATA